MTLTKLPNLILGGVTTADPQADGGELEEAEAIGGLVVPGGGARAVLQVVDAALDAVAQGVEKLLDAVWGAPIALGRDVRLPAAMKHILADGIAG